MRFLLFWIRLMFLMLSLLLSRLTYCNKIFSDKFQTLSFYYDRKCIECKKADVSRVDYNSVLRSFLVEKLTSSWATVLLQVKFLILSFAIKVGITYFTSVDLISLCLLSRHLFHFVFHQQVTWLIYSQTFPPKKMKFAPCLQLTFI